MCVHASIRLLRFYINFNISLIYKDIFTKFVGNVNGYKNISVRNLPLVLKNSHSQLFDNHKNVLNFEILQLTSSNLHNRYMATET